MWKGIPCSDSLVEICDLDRGTPLGDNVGDEDDNEVRDSSEILISPLDLK